MWYLHYVDCLCAKLINGMQEGLGTGSVNTQKEKVLDNLLLISKLTAMASADEVNGL
uniref:hypothetical protein n=1 Tax=Prevotella sp. TaxID=59823 RepID=UPI004024E128